MKPNLFHEIREAYRFRRVLVTGHTGFKGSWLSLWLTQLGASVAGFALEPPTTPNLFEIIDLQGKLTHIFGDVRDYDHLLAIFQSIQPEIVFHLAAQPLVRLSYREPRLTYETNVMGTVNVLEAMRHSPSIRAAIIVTSDKCYENQELDRGYREEDPMGGWDPYSSSKGCCELITSAYLHSFFPPEQYLISHNLAIASVRAGNVIGGGDWGMDRLVPDCVRALSQKNEIVLRYPQSVRPWQHVLDPLGGYLLLGAKLWQKGPLYSGSWNFGPADHDIWPVEKVVQKIIQLWGEGSYRVDDHPQFREAQLIKLDCNKSKTQLGWQSQYSIEDALSLSVHWYKSFYAGATSQDLDIMTTMQIERYVNMQEGPNVEKGKASNSEGNNVT
jgi:CDP-glucose 4,6-dehydratase